MECFHCSYFFFLNVELNKRILFIYCHVKVKMLETKRIAFRLKHFKLFFKYMINTCKKTDRFFFSFIIAYLSQAILPT